MEKNQKHITCLSTIVIYLVICEMHENCWHGQYYKTHKSDWTQLHFGVWLEFLGWGLRVCFLG